jgi:hypothetical protein
MQNNKQKTRTTKQRGGVAARLARRTKARKKSQVQKSNKTTRSEKRSNPQQEKMGSAISSKEMKEEIKKFQREEVIPQNIKTSYENNLIVAEYSRRMMLAQQQAIARDRVQWILGFYVVASGILAYNAWKERSIPKFLIIPIAGSVTAWLYQVDLAYYTKLNRVNNYFQQTLAQNNYWFNPIDFPQEPPKQQEEKKKE